MMNTNSNNSDSTANTESLLADAQAQLAAISSKLSTRLAGSRAVVDRLKDEFSEIDLKREDDVYMEEMKDYDYTCRIKPLELPEIDLSILDEPGPYDKPKRKSTFNPELADSLNPNKAAEVEQEMGRAKDGLKKVGSPDLKKKFAESNSSAPAFAMPVLRKTSRKLN
ncbi:Oidioi.mRNA.OKI2018_I69.XSR.g13379.t1.cds [Oikopleura dioica]|uniref:Oidioi.mRNA.OKI2018_I69.XSR.g13379.t1.cds n=1 Tax=Oikopleura dioica TaxID=34765 RepID=A0ABN7S6P0_OIKDI|nr:Oidioi.mRNA.OKI2018_I69.XSR.g13379.t1.cds [Oikopleura dioica]